MEQSQQQLMAQFSHLKAFSEIVTGLAKSRARKDNLGRYLKRSLSVRARLSINSGVMPQLHNVISADELKIF